MNSNNEQRENKSEIYLTSGTSEKVASAAGCGEEAWRSGPLLQVKGKSLQRSLEFCCSWKEREKGDGLMKKMKRMVAV